MKFSTREDIEAPIDYVYTRASDFAGFERQALRRGADVKRSGGEAAPTVGTTWDIAFKFRNKDRQMKAELVTLDDPNQIRIDTQMSGIDSVAKVDFVALSPKRTRMTVGVELTPKSLSARLLVQSLRLAKSNLSKRFASRVSDFAQTTEEDYRKVK